MGGKKKLSLKQMEKPQARDQRSGVTRSGSTKKDSTGISLPNPKNKQVVNELRKLRVLTPYTVASRLDLRLSVAKRFLKELERQGTIEYISSSKSLKIYKMVE